VNSRSVRPSGRPGEETLNFTEDNFENDPNFQEITPIENYRRNMDTRPSIGFDRRTGAPGAPGGERDSYLPRATGGPINTNDVRVSFTNTPLDQKRMSALPELNDQVPEIAFNCNGGYPVQLVKYEPRTGKFELNPEAVNVGRLSISF
jgi:hypothetical protein